jgi:hypothetical protein
MDSEYIKTKVGGGNHRMFDGGHDVIGAWEKIKDALPDDTLSHEIAGYVTGVWKDVTTSKGLPFVTLEKDSYDAWAEHLSGLGISKSYTYDLLSFDALEIFVSAFGVTAAMFAISSEDQKKLAESLASMGIVSIISANPIMGVSVIVTAMYGYKKKGMELDRDAALLGATKSLIFSDLLAAVSLPWLVEFSVMLVVIKLSKDHADKVSFDSLEILKSKIQELELIFKKKSAS